MTLHRICLINDLYILLQYFKKIFQVFLRAERIFADLVIDILSLQDYNR